MNRLLLLCIASSLAVFAGSGCTNTYKGNEEFWQSSTNSSGSVNATPTPTVTPTPTQRAASSTPTPTPTRSLTPTPTPTRAPGATPTPTPSPTRIPSVTPSPAPTATPTSTPASPTRSIELVWDANREAAVNRTGGGYRVYYSTTRGFQTSSASTRLVPYVSGSSAPTSVVLTGLSAGKLYVRIQAYSATLSLTGQAAESEISPEIEVTVQ